MMPFYHDAAKLLKEDESFKTDKPVVFAKVDATIEKPLTARFNIKGFPTLKSKFLELFLEFLSVFNGR